MVKTAEYPSKPEQLQGHFHHRHHGAKQPEPFDPARAALLDDPERFTYLPPEEIFSMLDAPSGATVVDFGTGTGIFAIELARRRPDLTVIAVDAQPQMLKLLEAKLSAQPFVNVKPMLATEMGAIVGQADRVLAINVLHELDSQSLQEMARLLKPSAFVLVVDWDREKERPFGPPAEHTYSTDEALAVLANAGLEPELVGNLPYHFVIKAHRKTE